MIIQSVTSLFHSDLCFLQLQLRKDVQHRPGSQPGRPRDGGGTDGNVCGGEKAPRYPSSPGLRGERSQ